MDDVVFTISKNNKTYISINEAGKFTFNTEEFPEMTADDFANEFITALNSKAVFEGMNVKQLVQAIQQYKGAVTNQDDVIYGLRARIRDMESALTAANDQNQS